MTLTYTFLCYIAYYPPQYFHRLTQYNPADSFFSFVFEIFNNKKQANRRDLFSHSTLSHFSQIFPLASPLASNHE